MLASLPDGGELARPTAALVSEVFQETHDSYTLNVRAERRETLPAFVPGQFSMVYAFGAGEIPISISGDPGRPNLLTYTIRSVGKASDALANLTPGNSIGLRGPFGTGWPLDAAKGGDVLIIAGGIGLAPLRPVIYYVLRHRKEFGRLTVLYGARSPKDVLYRSELKAWSGLAGTKVLTTVDRSGGSWRAHVGMVTNLIDAAVVQPDRTTAMMCGPEIMMRFAVRNLQIRKLARDRMYLSMERNMKCAMGLCGRCQMGPYFVCKNGPIFSYDRVRAWMEGRSEV